MKKFERECKNCQEQKKSSVCRECHKYWMGKLAAAESSRNSANGRIGAYVTNLEKAKISQETLLSDFIQLQHESANLKMELRSKAGLIKHATGELATLKVVRDDSKAAHEITKTLLTSEKSKNDVLLNAIYKIKAFCEEGTKLFARKAAINLIWKKTDQTIGRVTED